MHFHLERLKRFCEEDLCNQTLLVPDYLHGKAVSKLLLYGNLFEMNIPSFKNKMEMSLLTIQNAFDKYEWYPDLNFNIDSFKRIQ